MSGKGKLGNACVNLNALKKNWRFFTEVAHTYNLIEATIKMEESVNWLPETN